MIGRPLSLLALIAALAILPAAAPAWGQDPVDAAPLRDVEAAPASQPAGMPEIVTDCSGADDFGGTTFERAGWCLIQSRRYVGARTVADKALKANENSHRAQYIMGAALHLGDGNLPKSLFHLNRAEQRFIAEHGKDPGDDTPTTAYRRILVELVYVHGEMDHHEEKIRYVDALERRLSLDYGPLKAWPLLKLKRFDEARRVAEDAIASHGDGNSYWRAIGLTALCAVESERRNRVAAYEACKAAAQPVLRHSSDGGVALSNAGASAMEVFKFDEAERLYIESTKRDVEGTINPWGRLTHLYLRQGRFAEAVSALRQMQRYRMARPAYFDQQDQADAELTGASVLIIAGRVQDALRITRRIVDRPDRQGTSSAAADQNEAGNLILDAVVRLDVARRLEEQASWSKFTEAMKLRAEALKHRFDAWILRRKASTILSNRERLVTSLRPECPGSVELPAWLDGEVVQVVGPGVALAAIGEARREETLPTELAEPVFRAFEAEAHLLDGDEDKALAAATDAIEGLPAVEALVRVRVRAIAVAAARALGRNDIAVDHLQHILLADPGLIRRMGLELPVVITPASQSAAVAEAIAHLQSSPLFDSQPWGFKLLVAEDVLVLALPDGSELLRARVLPGKSTDVDSVARRIARSAHEELLVPNVDITQQDVRSLDGGLTGGGRASERVKSIMDEVFVPR